jgi:hypothetical protein
MINKKVFVFLMNIILVLSACTKKSELSAENGLGEQTDKAGITFINENLHEEESPIEIIDISNKTFINENYLQWKEGFIELIRKVPFPNEPAHYGIRTLKGTESFLELEKYSDELLKYALDLFQDGTVTFEEREIVAYVLLGTDFDKYKYFLRDLAPLFVEGKIDDGLAGFCFYPGIQGYGAYRNIKNPDNDPIIDPVIREALEIYTKSDTVDAETKASIIRKLNRSAN